MQLLMSEISRQINMIKMGRWVKSISCFSSKISHFCHEMYYFERETESLRSSINPSLQPSVPFFENRQTLSFSLVRYTWKEKMDVFCEQMTRISEVKSHSIIKIDDY